MTVRRNYLAIERPDDQVTIDFLSFNPEPGTHIPGCTVKLRLLYTPNTGTAELHVYIVDAQEPDSKVLMDECVYPSVEDADSEDSGT